MASLELRFLGDMAVVRGGEVLALPPSKRTRGLLAYLALQRRTFRREHLCELLWEVPDDPRGALRWSLSKLRRLVDEPSVSRIVADRATVAFEPADVEIDVLELKKVAGAVDTAPIATLEDAAGRFRGHLLEGLGLTEFHAFDAWCAVEREAATRAQADILVALARRLAGEPQRAEPYARALVGLMPYDEPARCALIQLLLAVGKPDQAEQQYRAGLRALEEAGLASSGALRDAYRGAVARGRSKPAPSEPAPESTRWESVDGPPSAIEPATVLVGRDREMQLVTAALRASFERKAAKAVLVCGEPGMGKSRLLEAAARRARDAGALVLEASAFESESIRPFSVWTDAIRGVSPEAATAIFEGTETVSRDRLLARLSDFVSDRLKASPVVLIVDDLHWADESSAAALHYAVRTHRDRPLLVVLAAREGELRDNPKVYGAVRGLQRAGMLEEVRLDALDEDALRTLIAARVPGSDAGRLSKECGGNPLLAIELARAELHGDSGESLAELVRERLSRLDVAEADALRWAAVMAPHVDPTTLSKLAGLDWTAVGVVLEVGVRLAILVPAERGFRFSHDLVARSIYADISPGRRRVLHRRVAELLERDTAVDLERAAELARHASLSGDAGLSARAMVSAGRLCLRFFANEEALSLARRGLAWAERLGAVERVCRQIELHEIVQEAAPLEDWEAVATEYAQLAEQALDLGALSHARRGYFLSSLVRFLHGQWTSAHQEILQSERLTRTGNDEQDIVGMAEAARCLLLIERDLPHADAMLMEVQALAARKRVSHPTISAALGIFQLHTGRLDEAEESLKTARALAKSRGDRFGEYEANEHLAKLYFERGDYEAARGHAGALLELGERLREGSERPFARAFCALCRYAAQGDAAGANSDLDAALVALRAVDAKHRLAYTLTRAALIDVERHRPADAIRRATEALEHAEALDRTTEKLLAHVALVRARQGLRDIPGSQAQLANLSALETATAASWARDRVAALTEGRSR